MPVERNHLFLKVPFRIIWMHLKSCHDSSKKLLFFLTYSKCGFPYSKPTLYLTWAVKEAKEVMQSLFDVRCKKVGMVKKYGHQGLLSCRPPPDVMFQKSMTEEEGEGAKLFSTFPICQRIRYRSWNMHENVHIVLFCVCPNKLRKKMLYRVVFFCKQYRSPPAFLGWPPAAKGGSRGK